MTAGRSRTVPKPGEPFFGQDAQYKSPPARYKVSDDGLTVTDANTGLTWQRSPEANNDGKLDRNDKFTCDRAQKRPAELDAARFGG